MKKLVILPTYNEKENLAQIVAMVLAVDSSFEVLIVDDHSPDGTGEIADLLASSETRVHVLHREKKLGLGTAYLEGFRFALDRNFDLIFEMDADFSHNPEYLPDFVEASRTFDLVIGSRYLQGVNVINWPLSRLLLSYGANMYVRLVTGLGLRDATSGFRCFRREVLEEIDLHKISSEGYAFQIELAYICWRKGFAVGEIPIVFVERRAGKTKMSRRVIAEAVWIVWKLKLLNLFGLYRRK
ncbi:MAG: polyprenol monophosphomannose synthase [Proteobacteria bacterium]|nr:polyprenol monophosphomannose synthase [Pseudomonadota bacterium]MBU1739180.1 polyprenol monophosphomannose synthase [Pseudomonadota bacterium]